MLSLAWCYQFAQLQVKFKRWYCFSTNFSSLFRYCWGCINCCFNHNHLYHHSNGISCCLAQDFHKRFPKIPYKTFLAINCLISFIIANMGLDMIISWSTPVLMLLYPLAISLVILGILSPLFKNDPVVHKITTALALIPALFDMINALPDALRSTSIIQTILSYAERYLPMFNLGFSWLTFSLAGLIIGLTIHFARGTSYATIED